ncbi:MAG: YqgE/AlgH family protein [Sporocytophaga sp.]|uniref:YqgE/AlgH family protein n=1 Tax=Sporocytophaga TaxID=1011 RepID=UPI000491B6B0|nr:MULTISPECIES: YqgE/AlgH family protein [Sporocytophaga]MBO9700409.1 YqgE/AlgH family protein [Sporocytophaga sp.]
MLKIGNVIISEPYLGDDNFERTVIIMCEYGESGALGLVLNKPTIITLNSVLESVNSEELLYIGGPVAQDSLHFIFRNNYNIEGAVKLGDNLYWGGNFEQVLDLFNNNLANAEDFRFFLGYSGWEGGQLENEFKANSWIVSHVETEDIFEIEPANLWREILKSMGGKYKMLSNYPIDPRLN